MAHSTPSKPAAPAAAFQPYVAASMSVAEFTIRAIILGALFGLIFGASTVYLGLRAGLTVSASIPIAVLAISVLKRLGGSTILENNIVQTIGSAGESLASGVVFTIPALIFLLPYGPAYFNYTQILLLAFAGGILGVLMMVPLRRALIVKEHGVLPYPEGTACADVLVAGEKGGALASTVFMGLGIGAAWKALSWIVQLFRTEVGHSMSRTSFFPNATVNVDISPEYMGVGYVIGPRIAGVMFAGGVLSWLVLVPLLSILGQYIPEPFPPVPASGLKLSEMTAGQIWSAYIRYIGAGAVLAAGLITLARTLPTILGSFKESMKGLGEGGAAGTARTEQDLPLLVVMLGTLALAIFLVAVPGLPTQGHPLVAVLTILFGFFFVSVSSRITGLIGNSSNPISGMTIATLILTCTVFVATGWTGDVYAPIALCVGAVVCIAAAIAGRDLAGPEDRVPGGRHAEVPADRPHHRRAHLGAGHRLHDAVPALGDGHRVAVAAGAASHPDVHDHQGPAQPEPAVGPGAVRRVDLDRPRAVRHPLAVVCRRIVSADCHHGAHLRRRRRAVVCRAEDRREGRVRHQRRHALQLGSHRRRLAGRHRLRGPLRPQHRQGGRRRGDDGADPVPARGHDGRDRGHRDLLRAGRRAVPRGAAEVGVTMGSGQCPN